MTSTTEPLQHLWTGWARDASGFSDELRGFLRALEAAGHRPSLHSFSSIAPTALSDEDLRIIGVQERRCRPGVPTVAIHSYVPWIAQPTIVGAINVVRAMFETDRLPERRLGLLLDRDEIWVPGEFNLETFERGGIPRERMHVLGGTLDFDLFSPGSVEPARLPVPDGHFTFLTNFAFSERKAWRQLLDGWSLAFGPDDGVCLVLKVHSEGRRTAIQDRIDASLRETFGPGWASRIAPIKVMDEVLPATAMPRLYAAADAYVLPTRGEGWGRPYMEAMAMGLPTIGSRWSGNLEFMHDGNSWLVDGDVVPVEHGEEVFLDPCHGHRWFAPDVESIAQQLRAVAADPAAARAKAAGARAELIERFGPEVIAARAAQLTTQAFERHAERRARPMTCAIRGPFGSVSSLAVVNDALADGLQDRGHNLGRHTPGIQHNQFEAPTISHSWPPAFDGEGSGASIAILPWEYGAPPAEWVHSTRQLSDRVWVPSDYVRRGYVECGMPPGMVEVIPNGVDLDHFTPDGPARPLDRQAGCTFLFVGGTIWRKGADLLLGAWAEAFGPDDDVQLVIKEFGAQTHYRGQSVIPDPAALAADPRLAPVVHLSDEVPYRDLPAIYRAADVLVTPYRAEGFCLPALEAMACGIPVIHNGEGPTAEFVPADGGWALSAQRAPLPSSSKLDLAAPGWVYEVSHDALVAALRAAAGDADERRRRGAQAAIAAREHGWAAAVSLAEQSLSTIAQEALPPVRSVRSGAVEGRANTMLYAPDWSGSAWPEALRCWTESVSAGDPWTLALFVEDADVAAVSARIGDVLAATGRDEDDLPDLALCLPSDLQLDNLVLGADGVLVDADGADRLPTFVRRRAPRLTPADAAQIAALVAPARTATPQPVSVAA